MVLGSEHSHASLQHGAMLGFGFVEAAEVARDECYIAAV
jgi:hypothetical protein